MSMPFPMTATPSNKELKEQILAKVCERSGDLAGLLSDLVRIPSVNPVFPDSRPRGEEELQVYLRERLEQAGFECELFEPDVQHLERYRGKPGFQDGRSFERRPNLAGTLRGNGTGRSLMLASHIDVVGVAPEEPWLHDPFGGEVDGGYIWGRGSADMKGGTACQLAAVEALLALGLRPGGDVIWASVVDEETGGMGTLALVDRGYTADAAFMPEPTSCRIVPMCRGILWGELIVRGRSSHIEIPQAAWKEGGAVDAIAKARLLLDALDELNADWASRPEKQHPLLPVPNQLYVSMVEAGQHPSSWAEQAKITFDIQYTANEADAEGVGGHVKHEVERYLQEVAGNDEWLTEHPPVIRWTVDANPGEVSLDDPLLLALQRSCAELGLDTRPNGTGFHTDSSILIAGGIPTVVFGPGEPDDAHQVDERVAVSELIRVTEALALTIADWGQWS
jgi:acetylornithine deacetylase